MWQRANALNVSLGNYLHWPNLYYHIINLYLVSLYIRLFTYLSVSPTRSIHHEIIEREFSNITLRLLGPLEKGRKVYERCPWLFIGRKRAGLNSWDAFHIIFLFRNVLPQSIRNSKYIKVHTATRWTVRYGLMLLWFTDLMNITEEVTIYRPNVSTLLSSAFIRGDLNPATRGPFIWSLISCLFFWRGVNRRQEVSRHRHDLKERGRS